jgi:hypothetical protein
MLTNSCNLRYYLYLWAENRWLRPLRAVPLWITISDAMEVLPEGSDMKAPTYTSESSVLDIRTLFYCGGDV